MKTVVELEGVNGERFTLTGPNAGDRGVYLGTGVKGIYDPPVKVVVEEPGNYPGARYLNHRILRRDVVFGVEILHDSKKVGGPGPNSWLSRDSEWRKAWAFDRDCKLYVTTEDSGTRYLKLRLFESPEVSTHTDPKLNTINRVAMVCIAYDPFWYEDDVVYEAVTQTDTRFDATDFDFPFDWDDLPKETLTITVDPSDGRFGLNPTDQAVFLKWTVPGSTEAPAEPYIPGIPWLGAPQSSQTLWALPDYSFEDEEQANRRIRLPGLIGGLRTEEVQKIYIDGLPTGGTWTLSDGTDTTAGIAPNASAATVKAAIASGFASVGPTDLTVSQEAPTNEKQTVKLKGGATAGDWTLTFDGQTTDPIPFNADGNELENALEDLSNIGSGNVRVTSSYQSEIQRVEVQGEPTDGTFTLTLDGHTTDPIPYNATTIQVALKLQALPNVGLLDIIVTGEELFLWGPYKIAFIGDLRGIDLNTMEADATGLEGGYDVRVKVESVKEGGRIYEVEFRGDLSGKNVAQMTGDTSGLDGGDDNEVVVDTAVDGSRPYVVTFTEALSGVDFPTMTINTSGLTGGSPSGRVRTTTEGATAPAENAVIDTDPRVEQVSSESGSQLWARMNGVRFRNPVPPYTPSKTFEITASGVAAGQMVTLRIPRPWSRPWGLE